MTFDDICKVTEHGDEIRRFDPKENDFIHCFPHQVMVISPEDKTATDWEIVETPRFTTRINPPGMGFDDDKEIQEWVEKNPDNNTYCCNWCGIYEASRPRCNECELST